MSELDQLIYDVSENGFLGELNTYVLSEEFDIFKEIIDNLNVDDGKNFRKLVTELPQESQSYYLNMIKDKNYTEIKKIYNTFTFICQKYIWCCGLEERVQTLPYTIGLIWYFCGKDRVVRPVSTYDALILNNWKLKDSTQPISLENLDVVHVLTGLDDERWFYKIHILIEYVGRNFVNDILNSEEIFKNKELTIDFFDKTMKMIDECSNILSSIKDKCKPDVFWNIIRIYLSGFEKEQWFPNGIQIENTKIFLKHKGGSGASSPLIQAIDLFFGVEHDTKHASEMVLDMRKYMSFKHRSYLNNIIKNNCTLVEQMKNIEDPEIIEKYNECLKKLIKFRTLHVVVVHRYIITYLDKIDEDKKLGKSSELNKNNPFGNGGSSALASKEKEPHALITLLGELVTDVKEKLIGVNEIDESDEKNNKIDESNEKDNKIDFYHAAMKSTSIKINIIMWTFLVGFFLSVLTEKLIKFI